MYIYIYIYICNMAWCRVRRAGGEPQRRYARLELRGEQRAQVGGGDGGRGRLRGAP